ncbi:MAG: ATP-binding cassette domain-containing protein [Paracoccaceae bacterium]|nr:ATP-binding cassette domain-containing protein [Paracoccaceae bacterium]
MLCVDDLSFGYPAGPSFRFTLAIAPGEIVTLSGESGSGKSTLIDLICGFLTPESGNITWEGRSFLRLAPAIRPVSALFQDGDLFDHLDVEMNIALGLDPRGRPGAAEKARVAAVLDEIGLPGYQRRLPAQLSGGQRQRVALARALVRDKPLMLLDEPFSALDTERRGEMADLVREIADRRDLATLVVSHDAVDAQRLQSRAVALLDGQIVPQPAL